MNDKDIYRNILSAILAYKGDKQVVVDEEELNWSEYLPELYNLGTLTLGEISEQLFKLGYQQPFHVWTELDLSGMIYQYANGWTEHGTTRGYA